jgi:predicted S18 family serine protease
VTSLATYLYRSCIVARLTDVTNAIKHRLEYEQSRLADVTAEMENLAAAYNRFRDLKEESEKQQESIKRLSLVFDMLKVKNPAPNAPMAAAYGYSLWEIMETYLQFAEKTKVGEILEFLQWIKFTTTRQAVESAITTHPRVFRTTKDGWEKYVSLKQKGA